MKWIIQFLASAAIVYLLANNLSGISVDGFTSSIVVVIVLSVLNMFLKPILSIISLPVNILTLGLFSLVINAFIVWLCGVLVSGFQVESFWYAFVFSIVLSVVQSLVNFLLFKK